MTLDQEKQRIVEEFLQNARLYPQFYFELHRLRMAGGVDFVSWLSKELDALHAAVVREIQERGLKLFVCPDCAGKGITICSVKECDQGGEHRCPRCYGGGKIEILEEDFKALLSPPNKDKEE